MASVMAAAVNPNKITPESQNQQPGQEHDMSTKPEIIRSSYKGADKLLNKVALITGGDSGIGRSVAVHFAREGADISIVYLPEEQEDAKETKALVEKEGRRCLLLPGNVGNPHECNQFVEKTITELSKLDILVNNAGEQHYSSDFTEVSKEQIEKTFTTNIFGLMFMAQAALKHMKSGCAIINTTSITAYKGEPQLLEYSATKGAIVSFTRSLSMQCVQKGIRVNAVAPGPIWTPLIPATFPKSTLKTWQESCPMGRAGQPSEVGPSYVFLASDDSSYFSGQVLHPNGGTVING